LRDSRDFNLLKHEEGEARRGEEGKGREKDVLEAP
jgi:hypothetical protein